MRIVDQILAVKDYQTEQEDVVGCFDGLAEAQSARFEETFRCPITYVRVKIVEVVDASPLTGPKEER